MNKKAFGVFLVLFLMCLLIVPINAYSNNTVTKTIIAAGSVHSLALKSDGTVVAWGRNNYNQCTVPSDLSGVVAIAAGSSHSLALKSDGTVVAWGRNNYNQCTVPSSLSGVAAIAAGSSHSLALKSDGTVVAWGLNNYNQCTVPSDLSGVVAIAGGSSHSVALKSDGTVVAWGQNIYGQCTVPSSLSGVAAIAAGSYHSVALKSDGTVVAWGFNASYNKGQATVPTGLSGVIAIAALSNHSLALKSDGTVVAWGDNSEGQCNVPSDLSGVVSVAAGGSHSLALKSDGTVVAWGASTYGQRTIPSGLNLAGLSGFVLNQGALSPDFSPDVFSYTASVDNSVSSIDVTPTVAGSVYIQIDGTDQDSGVPRTIPLSVGDNTVTISTSTADGLNSVYTATVTRAGAPLSSDATLSNLALSSGTLIPSFDPGTTSYTALVDNSVASLTITPTASESHASITVNGTAVASGQASQAIGLSVGANTVTVLVTAQDGTTARTYTLTVTRASGGAIASYAFDGIPFSVASSGTFNGALYVDGGHGLPSGYGQDYTQKFMLPAGAVTWARLYVGVWGGTYLQSGVLNVNFNGNALGTAGVGQGQATGIADMVEGSGCGVWWVAIDVTGNVVANSENTVVLRVTDPNNTGFDTRIYGTILVAAVAQPDGPKVSYQVAEGNICLHYDNACDGDHYYPANDQYTMSMDFPAGSIAPEQVAKAGLKTVYLTGHKNANDYLYLNGNLVSDNANDGSGASLDTNNSPYNTWSDKYFGVHKWDVTGLAAQNNSVVYQRGNETYESPVLAILTTQTSSSALSSLALSNGSLSPAFSAGATSYAASVDSSVSSVTVTPAASASSSTIKVNGTTVASGQASDPISLSVGANTVSVAVYAQDGSSQTYTVTVTRGSAQSQSGDDTLSGLAISPGSLSPVFGSGTTSYTASVDNSVSSITVTPTANESHATIKVNGQSIISGSASQAISLSVGANSVAIAVYAQDGTQQTYSVNVNRASGASGAAPTVLGITPASGTSDGETSVVITGSGFTGATAVNFGSTSAGFTVDSDTQITATSPDVTGTGLSSGNPKVDVTVTTAGGNSATGSSDQFTYIPAGYFGMNKAASPLATSLHGKDTGGLIFNRGDSAYYSQLAVGGQYTVHYNVSGIPDGATIIAARLYHYYCWSYTGLPAQGAMTLNGQSAAILHSYADTKGMNPYNYPFGTISYDATGLITGNGAYTSVFTNTGASTTCPFGTGLVIVYHDSKGQSFEYWLNEGADIIWPGSGVTADQATTRSSFPGTVDTSKVAGAELITVVTSGNKGLNSLTFNNQTWGPNPSATVAPYGGPYADASQLAVDDRDVTDYVQSGNGFSIQSGGSGTMGSGSGSSSFSQADTMVPSNAFLVVTYKSATVSSDATLSSLAISSGNLSPAFDPGTLAYTASVANTVTSDTVTAVASSVYARVYMNGNLTGSLDLPLAVGDNSVAITVYAQDGTTSQTYTITVNRAAPAPAGPVVTGINPGSGPSSGSTSVIITGSGFTGTSAVKFGSTAVASGKFTVNSDTQITATSPAATSGGPVDVTVTTPNGTSATGASDQFTYILPPGYLGMNAGASALTTSLHGTDKGDLIFTMGDSAYKGSLAAGGAYTVNYNVSGIPAGATVTAARLYAYYTYSTNGQPAQAGMALNDQSVSQLNSYTDTKGMDPYNYPSGNISYDVTGKITGNGTYTAVLTNTGTGTFSMYGIGLVVVYRDPNGQSFEYWLNEGADIIDSAYGVTPAQATTSTGFSGTIDTSQVSSARLITVVPSGDKGLNQLTFGGTSWTGVYKTANLAVDDRDVTDSLRGSGNSCSIQDRGDYMCPTNAFLVVTYKSAAVSSDATLSSLAISSGSLSPAFDSGTLSYTDSVDNGVSTVSITPTASEGHAIVTVNGAMVTSGSASDPISLGVGNNTINVVVTAQDGTRQTYSVNVHRAAPPAGAPVISPNGRTYNAPQSISVSISAELTVDRAVYYTTNGSDPTVAGSVYYTEPFSLYLGQGTTTVQAAVYDSGSGNWSGIGSAVFVVSINPPTQNSSISPATATFDKNTGGTDCADVPVALTLNGNTLVDVKNNGAALGSGTDYTASGSIVTILKSYLASLSVGETGLTFDFSAGNPAILTVNVKDTTPAPPATVHVTGVSLDKSADTIAVSAIDQLTAAVAPDNATDKSVTWSSSDASVATVDQTGKVTAVAAGTATIAVTTTDGGFKATCAVAVPKAVTVTAASPAVTVTTTPLQVTVPSGVTNATLTTSPVNGTATLPQISVQSSTSLGDVQVSIPSGTQITGPSTWNGTINLPQVVASNSVAVTPDSGYTASVSAAIEIGLGDTELAFSQPARILLAGQGGKDAGWVRNGVFTKISYQMSVDSAAALGANADGYLSVGNDLAIWTTHFTTFVAYAETANSSGGGGGSGITAPGVQTSNATAITDTSATLSGSITSGGGTSVTAYGFLWGTDQNNLNQKQQVGTDNYSGSFQAGLSGLKPETTYYFKAYATNSQGTRQGDLKQFTTAGEVSPPPVPAPVFSDVPASYWASEAINDLNSRGYVTGYPDGSFKPDGQITRAELVSIMNGVLKLPAAPAGAGTRPATPSFSDVASGDWFYVPVENAVHAGIVKGYGDTFSPNDPITREQLACILVNALGRQDEAQASLNGKTGFTDDAGISGWARGFVAAASKDGLIRGYQEDNSFRPQHSATRAEACAMIGNLLKVKK